MAKSKKPVQRLAMSFTKPEIYALMTAVHYSLTIGRTISTREWKALARAHGQLRAATKRGSNA